MVLVADVRSYFFGGSFFSPSYPCFVKPATEPARAISHAYTMTRNDAGSDGRHRPQTTNSTVLPSAAQTRKLAGRKLSVGQTISSLRLRRAARHRLKLRPIQAEPATIRTSATGLRRTITVIDKAVSVAQPRHNAALTDSDLLGGIVLTIRLVYDSCQINQLSRGKM